MRDKLNTIFWAIVLLGIIAISIAIISAKIHYWNTPISECPMWVVWLLK